MPDTHAPAADADPDRGPRDFRAEHGRRAYLCRRAAAFFARHLRRELSLIREDSGLNRHHVLTALLCDGPLSVTGVADRSVIEQPTATKIIDLLVAEGLAARGGRGRRRRVVRIALTEAGEAVASEMMAAERRAEAAALAESEAYRRPAFLDALRDGAVLQR